MNNQWLKRLTESKVIEYLEIFGGIRIIGPRFVGKTALAEFYSKTRFYLSNPDDFELVRINLPSLLMEQQKQILIDEWQILSSVLTTTKFFIDQTKERGVVIFTGSINYRKLSDPAAGRFWTIKLRPLSLFESGDSEQKVSLSDLIWRDKFQTQILDQPFSLEELIMVTCRGGFPNSVLDPKYAKRYNQEYADSVINFALSNDQVTFKKSVMINFLKYCAVLDSQFLNLSSIDREIFAELADKSWPTLAKYRDILENDLMVIESLNSYSTNLSSTDHVLKKPKIYFCDPCVPIAINNFSPERLIRNLNTFGFYFENLVYRDLQVYADYYGAKLFYYRNSSGPEVDFIIQFDDQFVAIEVKLDMSEKTIQQAAKNLIYFKNICQIDSTKCAWNPNRDWIPSKLIVITGLGKMAYKTDISGEEIYVIPIKAMMP